MRIQAGAVVLATGCRERTRGAIGIPGARPAGVYCAGTAQYIINIQGQMVGKEAVILGSGDIGLIMARRLTYEGARVRAVCEILPYSSGLSRNVVQCLHDFDIPLLLNHTVVRIHGRERVRGVTVARVDERRNAVADSAQFFPCDTLLLSVGLIPENELIKQAGLPLEKATGGPAVDSCLMTDMDGIFACGNALHVHDLVDFVSEEAEEAGKNAASFAAGAAHRAQLAVLTGENVHYTVPQRVQAGPVTFRLRVTRPVYKARIRVLQGDRVLFDRRKRVCTPGEMDTAHAEVTPGGGDVLVEVREGK